MPLQRIPRPVCGETQTTSPTIRERESVSRLHQVSRYTDDEHWRRRCGGWESQDYTGMLVYVYYYQNQFIVFDSNLVSKYTGHTLDTNATVKFSVGFLDSHRKQVIAGNQQANNKRVVFAGSHLLIQSGLIAQNESPIVFSRFAVIDVFDLSDGHYQYSFYIPKPVDEAIRDFTVRNDHLYVLAGHMVFRYQLNLPTKRR